MQRDCASGGGVGEAGGIGCAVFLALFVAMALFALVSVGGMVPCPFLTANKSCCPRSHAPEKKCPLSESLDNCPFFMTERKIGMAEATLESWYAPPVREVVGEPGDGECLALAPRARMGSRTCDRCVLNRVLLL